MIIALTFVQVELKELRHFVFNDKSGFVNYIWTCGGDLRIFVWIIKIKRPVGRPDLAAESKIIGCATRIQRKNLVIGT